MKFQEFSFYNKCVGTLKNNFAFKVNELDENIVTFIVHELDD